MNSHPPRLDDPELAAQRLPFEDFEEGIQPVQQGIGRCPRPKFEDYDAGRLVGIAPGRRYHNLNRLARGGGAGDLPKGSDIDG